MGVRLWEEGRDEGLTPTVRVSLTHWQEGMSLGMRHTLAVCVSLIPRSPPGFPMLPVWENNRTACGRGLGMRLVCTNISLVPRPLPEFISQLRFLSTAAR